MSETLGHLSSNQLSTLLHDQIQSKLTNEEDFSLNELDRESLLMIYSILTTPPPKKNSQPNWTTRNKAIKQKTKTKTQSQTEHQHTFFITKKKIQEIKEFVMVMEMLRSDRDILIQESLSNLKAYKE